MMEEQRMRVAVTGASRGIGRSICLALAGQGASLAVGYAGNARAAQETVDACLAAGAPMAVALQADVSQEQEAAAFIRAAAAALGGMDVLINNAGITRDNLLMRLSAQDLDQVLDTNLKGAFYTMREACRPMMKQRFGRIINITSVVGLRGNAGQANYAASKAGLIGLSKSFAKEVARRGITVNCVAPGFIQTDMTTVLPDATREKLMGDIPLGRLGQPEDVAAAVAFLASPQAGYITGQVLCVDGGMAM